jgi:hypothetical protein
VVIRASERLAAYWAEALGGPATFSAKYGDETSVVRMHSGHGVHEEMDRRAIACFDEALKDAGFAGDDDHDVPLPPVGRRCAGRLGDTALVLGRTCRRDVTARRN